MGKLTAPGSWRSMCARVRSLVARLLPGGRWLAAGPVAHMDPNVPILVSKAQRELMTTRYRLAACHALGTVALDVGCGTGYGSSLLRDGGAAFVLGLDKSDSAVRYADLRYAVPTVRFGVADAASLPAKAGTVDLLVSFGLLEHLPPPSVPAVLQEYRRVLRPGGTLIISAFAGTGGAGVDDDVEKRYSYDELAWLLQPCFRIVTSLNQDGHNHEPRETGRLAGLTPSTASNRHLASAYILLAHPRQHIASAGHEEGR